MEWMKCERTMCGILLIFIFFQCFSLLSAALLKSYSFVAARHKKTLTQIQDDAIIYFVFHYLLHTYNHFVGDTTKRKLISTNRLIT